MSAGPSVLRALDAALEVVARAERRGMRTRADLPAEAELTRLREGLAAQRERVRQGEPADAEALGGLVRDVAAWTPDSELKLLAALGAVVQATRS